MRGHLRVAAVIKGYSYAQTEFKDVSVPWQKPLRSGSSRRTEAFLHGGVEWHFITASAPGFWLSRTRITQSGKIFYDGCMRYLTHISGSYKTLDGAVRFLYSSSYQLFWSFTSERTARQFHSRASMAYGTPYGMPCVLLPIVRDTEKSIIHTVKLYHDLTGTP